MRWAQSPHELPLLAHDTGVCRCGSSLQWQPRINLRPYPLRSRSTNLELRKSFAEKATPLLSTERSLKSIRHATTVFAQKNQPLHPSTIGNTATALLKQDNLLTRIAHVGDVLAERAGRSITPEVEAQYERLLAMLRRFVAGADSAGGDAAATASVDPLSVMHYSAAEGDDGSHAVRTAALR